MKIALVTEFFYNQKNANAYCANMLVKGLIGVGAEVDVFTIRENDEKDTCAIEDLNVFPLRREKRGNEEKDCSKLQKLGIHISKLCQIPMWPLESPYKETKTFATLIEEQNRKKKYDGIVAIHKSYLSVYVCGMLKKKSPNTKQILYLLDPIANEIDKFLGIRRFLFPIVKKAEKKAFSRFDCVIQMKCNENAYDNEEFSTFQQKFSYVDFPLICEDSIERRISKSKLANNIRFIYFGTLNSIYRSPEYMIKVFEGLAQKRNIAVELYVEGDCIQAFTEGGKRQEIFDVHGFIDSDELTKQIKASDIIINIGNAMSSMLPSKVLEMIMYGKPIISFSKQENDVCESYMERYGHALTIKETERIDTSIDLIEKFISYYMSIPCDITKEMILENFVENTPEFSAKRIISLLQRGNHDK